MSKHKRIVREKKSSQNQFNFQRKTKRINPIRAKLIFRTNQLKIWGTSRRIFLITKSKDNRKKETHYYSKSILC